MSSTTTTRPNGRLLRELRIERGLSIHALARLANVSTYSILLYERHNFVPKSPRTREKIAAALGVSPDELFGTEPQEVMTP